MKVKELINKLQKLNPENDVMIALKENNESHLGYEIEYKCDITDANDSAGYTYSKDSSKLWLQPIVLLNFEQSKVMAKECFDLNSIHSAHYFYDKAKNESKRID